MNTINPDLAVLAAGSLADLLDFVPAGADEVACARCGRPLAWGVATSEGVLGGDCVATVTGDHTTRARARRAEGLISTWGEFARVRVTADRPDLFEVRLFERGASGGAGVTFGGRPGTVAYALARWYAEGRGIRRAAAR